MAPTVEEVITKTEKLVIESKENPTAGSTSNDNAVAKEANVAFEIEPKTGVSFPVKLDDGKELMTVGLRKKTLLGIGLKIYGFAIFADKEKLKELMRSKIGNKAPAKPTNEMYQSVIDSDIGMTVRLVFVSAGVSISLVKKSFSSTLEPSVKKLNGGKKDDQLTNRVFAEASDSIKLGTGSTLEVTKLRGFIFQTKVKGEVVSTVESELLCRAYFHMYLGEDAFDKDAKEKFGMSLLSLF